MELYVLGGTAVGFVMGWLLLQLRFKNKSIAFTKTQAALETEVKLLQERKQDLLNENASLKQQFDQSELNNKSLLQKQALLETSLTAQKNEMQETREQFRMEFKNLANDIFEEKSLRFNQQSSDNLSALLNPLKENIKEFKSQIEKSYKEENAERITLKAEIGHLLKMNQQLSDDANRLASALKGENKTQGNWGEYQLEMILEKAELVKGIHYHTQQHFKDEDGKAKQPDFIISLPENKNLVIDSKVSLVAYEAYCNAEEEETQAIQLKKLAESIRSHIKDLHSKRYHELYGINSPDYVMLFVAIEPAFATVLKEVPQLFQEALEKNIVLVTASTLLATMKTVSFIWKQENQKKNVLEIARQSGLLYDKFAGFVTDMEKIGIQLDRTQKEYDSAMNKLQSGKGNLIGRAEKIRQLGANTSKRLPSQYSDEANQDTLHPKN